MDSKYFVDIKVTNNNGSPWVKTMLGMVKGYAFIENRLLTPDELMEHCHSAVMREEADDTPDCERILQQLNGCFSVILNLEKRAYIISDRMKTYPLFYQEIDGAYYITDTAEETLKILPKRTLDRMSLLQFLSCGYLTSGNSLFSDVKLAPPGYIVEMSIYGQIIYHYTTRDPEKVHRSKDDLFRKGMEALENSFKRSLRIVGKRTIVVPLSGGYDSRLIACLCRKYNIENVICFSYGIEGSREVETSRRVAEKLGYPWHSVVYTAEKWGEMVRSTAFTDYIKYGGNLNAVAHIQDFLALHELTERGVIPSDSVFMPGHTGDVIGGSQLPMDMNINTLARNIYEKYYCLNIVNRKARKEIHKDLTFYAWTSGLIYKRSDPCYEGFYQWGVNSRQSNFIINSVRAYEFFGHSWQIPLWDSEFEQLWNSVPFKERMGSALYNEFLFESYFEPMQVAFRKNNECGLPSLWQRFVRRFTSANNRYRIKLLLNRNGLYDFPKDEIGLDEAAKVLRKMFTTDQPDFVLQKDDIMSVKALYYLYLLNPAKERD